MVDSSYKLFVKLFLNVIKQLRVSAQREFNAASAFEAMFHEHGFIQCISVILGHKLQLASQIIWRGYIPICFICPWNADFYNFRLNANSTILREEQIYCISYGKFRDRELKIMGIQNAEAVLDAVKDYVENGEVWV